GKWSPGDGYGCEIVFQKSAQDQATVELPASKVKILHLHGAVGWYRKPALRPDYALTGSAGALPLDALSSAPLETAIALDPKFLEGLGAAYVDASLPRAPAREDQILIQPSFLKDLSREAAGEEDVFPPLWCQAAEALRLADEIIVMGYSLPEADSAAFVLLRTNCDREKTRVVNPDHRPIAMRLGLCAQALRPGPGKSFEDWLAETPDCP
ncbi:MAG TPA: hypothetical protein VEU62_01980, partial [Bryobacterales bacterium]|nr:hypothetical protein [Bryobacterales bacterium]